MLDRGTGEPNPETHVQFELGRRLEDQRLQGLEPTHREMAILQKDPVAFLLAFDDGLLGFLPLALAKREDFHSVQHLAFRQREIVELFDRVRAGL